MPRTPCRRPGPLEEPRQSADRQTKRDSKTGIRWRATFRQEHRLSKYRFNPPVPGSVWCQKNALDRRQSHSQPDTQLGTETPVVFHPFGGGARLLEG